MLSYTLRRLFLLIPTLFCIILVNFVIINLAPGDPTTVTDISSEGMAVRKATGNVAFGGDVRYLQFREFYGLTLPILFNTWPFISQEEVLQSLERLSKRKREANGSEMTLKQYDDLRVRVGDQSRFIMPHLKAIMNDPKVPAEIRALAAKFFVRGGTRQAVIVPQPTEQQRIYNNDTAKQNKFLADHVEDFKALDLWYDDHLLSYAFEPDFQKKIAIFFFDTRFFRYMSRVLTLDFGTMRNDPNKSVIDEVTKRFKYSLTLSIIPMFLTFGLCQLFGFYMAYRSGSIQEQALNFLFLFLYALPIFVAAPFLIEKIALHHTFPWNGEPIPFSGFTSPQEEYLKMTSLERLKDILQHLLLPFVAIMYGSLAAQTRLSKTAVMEVMKQDYVRTAKAKGLHPFQVLFKHIGRNAGITIVTSLSASLGAVLGGALIVETLFEINGFGKFFYDAILNRDFNVILFSAIAGSFLALLGYLLGDLLYMVLDPRVTLEKE